MTKVEKLFLSYFSSDLVVVSSLLLFCTAIVFAKPVNIYLDDLIF